MKNRITTLMIVVALLMAGKMAKAQNGYNLPYSQFGVGMSLLNVPASNALGGVRLGQSSANRINFFNPASYAAIEMESFVFDMGLTLEGFTQKDNEAKISDFDGYLSYVAIGFPLTKWWKMSAGLIPYSEVGYSSVHNENRPVEGTVKTSYDGSGSVIELYWGNGFNVTKNLSLGFNMNYLFGSIERAVTYDFVESDVNHFADSRRQKSTTVSTLTFDFGANYLWQIDEKRKLNIALTWQMPRKGKTHDTSWVYTLSEGNGSNIVVYPTTGDGSYTSTLEVPMKVGLGLDYEWEQKWKLAGDVEWSQWNGLKYIEGASNPVFAQKSVDYVKDVRVALGGGWTGDKESSNYWRRIGITGGVHYEHGKLGLDLNNGSQILDEYGVGMGFSFPMRKGRSMLTLSFSYSSFGNSDVLKTDCFVVGLSLGSCESWFVKRKYN